MVSHRPQMATVRPGDLPPGRLMKTTRGKLSLWSWISSEELIDTQTIERSFGEQVDLTGADVLVAGGRGIDGDFEMLEKLAELLGGEIGATRPPVDEGISNENGRSAKRVLLPVLKSPDAAASAGRSILWSASRKQTWWWQSTATLRPPIFDYADYCIVGDVHGDRHLL